MKIHPGALVLVLCGVNAIAAESLTVAVGRRVRVTQDSGASPLVGKVVGIEPGVLLLTSGSDAPSRITVGPATRVEVSGGRKSKLVRGAVLGAAVGAMPGVLMTVGDYNTDEHSPAAVAAIGAAAGAAVGAAIGWAIKTEQWFPADTATLTAGIAPVRGGVALSLHVAWGAERRRPQTDPALTR